MVVAALHTNDAREALGDASLQSLPDDALRTYLAGRRWFGAKGRSIRSTHVEAAIPVTWAASPDERYAIAIVRVDLEDGGVARYQLPLGLIPSEQASTEQVLASVETSGGMTHALVDATTLPAF